MATLLDGKIMAQEIEDSLKLRVEALKAQGVEVGLTVILVGEDPASQTYVGNKEKACARLGIRSNTLRMPADTTQETLEAAILEANRADMEKAAATISPVMLDRLKLTPERIEGMAKGICEQMPFEVRQPSVIMRSTRRAASAILASPSATVLSS